MKKTALLVISIICFALTGMAQAPQQFSYQSVIRDADNNLITEQEVGVQVSILLGSAEGTAVYVETQNPETNANGLISIQIGGGNTTDDFSSIDWADGAYYLKVSVDPEGGTNYTITAVSRILSVPYALHAKTAEIAETFTGYEELVSRIEALEEALDIDDPDPGTVTDIDGNVYQTVIIGSQEWMAENLRVSRYSNGAAIPTGLSDGDWENTTNGAYAIYNNDDNMLEAYGKLYNWYAATDARGLCPEGWRIPSDDDWSQLVNHVASQGFPNDGNNPEGAGNALKSCRQVGSPLDGCDTSEHPRWNWNISHYGFDEFGFSAFPGGYRSPNGSFGLLGQSGFWWSSTVYWESDSWYRRIEFSQGSIIRSPWANTFGMSLRCVRDN